MREGDVYKAVVNVKLPFSVEARNVFMARYMLPQGDDANAIESFHMYLLQLYSTLPLIISTLVTIESFDLYYAGRCGYEPLQQQPHVGNRPLGIQGTRLDDMLPNQIAMLVTGLLTSGSRPAKKFLPGITEGLQSSGTVVASVIAALADFGLAWITPFGVETGDEWQPVVYTKRGICRSFGGFVVRDLLATQRRRKPGVGI